jgi:hypothetical protein
MLYKEVKIKVDGENILGYFDGENLEMPNEIEIGDSLNVDGKDYKVLSHLLDSRDNILKIKLAVASLEKGAKNGESIKGRDKGKS